MYTLFQVTISLQKYAHERIHFEHFGEYLVLKIPDLSEQRPSLIPGDRAAVTDPPNCTKRLGNISILTSFFVLKKPNCVIINDISKLSWLNLLLKKF